MLSVPIKPNLDLPGLTPNFLMISLIFFWFSSNFDLGFMVLSPRAVLWALCHRTTSFGPSVNARRPLDRLPRTSVQNTHTGVTLERPSREGRCKQMWFVNLKGCFYRSSIVVQIIKKTQESTPMPKKNNRDTLEGEHLRPGLIWGGVLITHVSQL